MRLPVLVLSAAFALAMTAAGLAQATLPNDAGTARDDTPVREQALDCTCRATAADAAAPTTPEGDAAPGDRIIDCSCRKAVPDTTGTLACPELR